MSKLFGPMIQQGYIVPDLQAGMAHWLARGVGPFYVIPPFTLEAQHYGQPTECRITAAFACSGDQQIELIEPLAGSGPNIYDDYLKEHPEGGLQHLASWSDDVDAQLADLTARGVDYVLAQRYPGSHAYLDLRAAPGVMIQLMPTLQRYLDLFDVAQAEAIDWDGSHPIRDMDWTHPV
ncbi:VOC family protein [Iodidimonas sp. SYSU 1G8]|uniref:VOC family protein n=1 Tax=Iodidimonas sp. SYSU 1G8 TaxID=3133967 RepID=UPI0031FEC342